MTEETPPTYGSEDLRFCATLGLMTLSVIFASEVEGVVPQIVGAVGFIGGTVLNMRSYDRICTEGNNKDKGFFTEDLTL